MGILELDRHIAPRLSPAVCSVRLIFNAIQSPMKRFLSRLLGPVSVTAQTREIAQLRKNREFPCSVEALESRIAPAAVAVFSKGTLLIQGNPDGTLGIEQTVEVVGSETVVTTIVTENSAPLAGISSFEGVKNIVVKLDRAATNENQINFDLRRLPGSVEVLAPKNAVTNVLIQGLEPVEDLPQIGKSVLFKGGSGAETLVIFSADIGKGLVFPAGKGGATAFIGGDVSIGSSVSLMGANNVQINGGAQIGGDLLITQKTDVTESFVLGSGAKIDGNLVIFAGKGSTTINAYSEIGGRAFINAGQGANAFNVSLIAKSLQYVGGSSMDSVSLLRSEIAKSATFILSGGSNQVFFNVGPMALLGDFSVGKNLEIGGGQEADLLRLDSPVNTLSVGGKAVFSLSNGDNILVWDGEATGKSISIATGGGKDVVNVFGLAASSSSLNVNLGGGDDRLLVSDTFAKASLNGSSGSDEIVSGSVLSRVSKVKGFEVSV